MNSRERNYSRWKRWLTVSFFIYCLSTIFMIFFSVSAVHIWPYPWNRLSIIVCCLFPLFMILVWKIPHLIRDKKLDKKLIYVSIIIILGILNIVFSENRPITLKVMVLFLISGVGIFFATSYLLDTKIRKKIFLFLCWACLVAFCIYGILEYLNKKTILIFSYNQIPAGSLIILLSVGPILLFSLNFNRLPIFQLATIVFGIIIIFLIGKKGPILAVLLTVFLAGLLFPRRRLWIIIAVALMLAGTAYKLRHYWLPLNIYFDEGLRVSDHKFDSYHVSAYIKGEGNAELYVWWYDAKKRASRQRLDRYRLEENYRYVASVFQLPIEAEMFRIAFLLRPAKVGYSTVYIDDFKIEAEEKSHNTKSELFQDEKRWHIVFISDFEHVELSDLKNLDWWTYSKGRPVDWPWGLTKDNHNGRYAIYLRQVDRAKYWLYTGLGPLKPLSLRGYLITSKSTIFRLENYALAAHIFLQKPLFGIGLHAPLVKYIKDYNQKVAQTKRYKRFIKEKKTFDNMLLCGLVEMGSLLSIAYILLCIYLMKNFFIYVRDNPEKRQRAILFILPLVGFFIHSLTFDSLIYPHLNWLFHSYLGLMANFDKI